MFSVIFSGVCLIKHPLVVFGNLCNYVNFVFMLMKGWISFFIYMDQILKKVLCLPTGFILDAT